MDSGTKVVFQVFQEYIWEGQESSYLSRKKRRYRYLNRPVWREYKLIIMVFGDVKDFSAGNLNL